MSSKIFETFIGIIGIMELYLSFSKESDGGSTSEKLDFKLHFPVSVYFTKQLISK